MRNRCKKEALKKPHGGVQNKNYVFWSSPCLSSGDIITCFDHLKKDVHDSLAPHVERTGSPGAPGEPVLDRKSQNNKKIEKYKFSGLSS